MNTFRGPISRVSTSILREVIYGGHILSLGASGIVLTIVLVLALPVNVIILIIPYLSSQVVYTYNHFREIEFDIDTNPERAQHLQHQKRWMSLVLLGYLLVLFSLLFQTNLYTSLFVIAVVSGGILYTEYIKEIASRYFAGLKNVYTSFFWALTIFIIPCFYQTSILPAYLYLFIFVFLRWIVNSAFFDIKDITSDDQREIRTFATLFGKKRTIDILHTVNVASAIPLFLGIHLHALPINTLLLALTSLYGFCYLTRSAHISDKSLRTLSYLVVDAEYIIWPLLILAGRIIF